MAYISNKHLAIWLVLTCMCFQPVINKRCTFIGSEETYSFYLDGDVILGGLFPLHFQPDSTEQSFVKKPVPYGYKL